MTVVSVEKKLTWISYQSGVSKEDIGLLILGFCVWMILRHPLKSLSFLFKGGFLLVLGLGAFLVLWWVLLIL